MKIIFAIVYVISLCVYLLTADDLIRVVGSFVGVLVCAYAGRHLKGKYCGTMQKKLFWAFLVLFMTMSLMLAIFCLLSGELENALKVIVSIGPFCALLLFLREKGRPEVTNECGKVTRPEDR